LPTTPSAKPSRRCAATKGGMTPEDFRCHQRGPAMATSEDITWPLTSALGMLTPTENRRNPGMFLAAQPRKLPLEKPGLITKRRLHECEHESLVNSR
jgi:hypothetical protein